MQLPKRKNVRLKDFDYSGTGMYFVTFCTQGKQRILSAVVKNGEGEHGNAWKGYTTVLTGLGRITEAGIRFAMEKSGNVRVESYVIMPNHVHMLLSVKGEEENRKTGADKAVPSFISALKRHINSEAGRNLWQRSYYDHIIRNEDDRLMHARYILENPAKWALDPLFTGR